MLGWKILLYETLLGDSPVKGFIDSLQEKTQGKVHNAIELLKECNIELSAPHVKKLTGTNLWELRVLGEDNVRIFYIAIENKTFILLHGFKKKKQKTPSKEIAIAQSRLREFQIRNKN